MAVNLGHSPRAVCVIGGTPMLVRDYDLVMTNKGEADQLTVNIDLEYLDSSVFLGSERYEIEIWAGYINESKFNPNHTFEKLILNNKYKDFLFKRFEGVIDQPEWRVGMENIITLRARDFVGLLMDNKFSENRTGGTTSAKEVIRSIQSKLTGITISIDTIPNYMGTINKGKRVYNVAGKSYWDVILDVARTTGLNILRNGKSIKLTKVDTDPKVWLMIKTNTKDDKKPWDTFDEVTVRYGVEGRQQKENVYVEVRAPGKKRNSPVIVGKYPKNATGFSGEENTKYILKRIGYYIPKQEADVKAEAYAMQYLRGYMTGTLNMPFANPEWRPDDCISFMVDEKHPLYKAIKPIFATEQGQKIFRIDQIQERFSIEGFSQTIEFETHPQFEIKKFGELKKTAPGTF